MINMSEDFNLKFREVAISISWDITGWVSAYQDRVRTLPQSINMSLTLILKINLHDFGVYIMAVMSIYQIGTV